MCFSVWAAIDDLYGLDGDDILFGGDGNDDLYGGAGNDLIVFGQNNVSPNFSDVDFADGGDGIDTISYEYLAELRSDVPYLNPSAFNTGYDGSVVVDLFAGTSSYDVRLGTAVHTASFVNIENVIGTASDDVIRGANTANTLSASGGDDLVYGFGGDDNLTGGDGDDKVDGGQGDDVIIAGRGADRVFGGADEDTLVVSGADQGAVIDMTTGIATLSTTIETPVWADTGTIETRSITYYDNFTATTITANLTPEDVFRVREENIQFREDVERAFETDFTDQLNELNSGTTDDMGVYTPGLFELAFVESVETSATTFSGIENLEGTMSADSLTGNNQDNQINGAGGDDILQGGFGDDMLSGGQGIDTIYGDQGSPTNSFGFAQINIGGMGQLAGGAYTGATNEYLDVGALNGLNGDALTFEMLYQASDVDRSSIDGSFYMTYSAGGQFNEIIIQARNDEFRIWVNNAVIDTGVSTEILENGALHRLSYTFEALNFGGGNIIGRSILYIDGVEVYNQGIATPGSAVSAGGRLVIGQEQDSAGNTSFNPGQILSGSVGDVRIWNYARSENEIADAAFTAVDPTLGELLDQWSFDTGNVVNLAGTNVMTVSGGAIAGQGSPGDDVIDGGAGDDVMFGEAGDDLFLSSTEDADLDDPDNLVDTHDGADIMNGGTGIDTVSYENSSTGVIVDLIAGMGQGGDAEGDNYALIESIIGSAFDDTLISGSAEGRLLGDGNSVGIGAVITGGDDTLTQQSAGSGAFSFSGDYDVVEGTLNGGDDIISGDMGTRSSAGDALRNFGTVNGGDDIITLTGSDQNRDFAGDVYVAYAASTTVGGDDMISVTGHHSETLWIMGDIETVQSGAIAIGGDDTITVASTSGVTSILIGDVYRLLGELTAGDDTISGWDGSQTLTGDVQFLHGLMHLAGNDIIDGGAGDDFIYGEYITLSGGMITSGGHDTLSGGDGDDRVFGQFGNDILHGDAGDDWLFGGEGQDVLSGGADNDQLYGDSGNDTLNGDAGNDQILGGDGADTLLGNAGADVNNGGAGFDTMDYRASTSRVVFDVVTGGTLGDAAGDSYIDIERFYGSNFNDTMTGSAANEFLYGEDGNDVINGGGGIDRIYGGASNDVQRGQDGNDTLYGSSGADQLNGGVGTDVANYSLAIAAVAVNMATGGTGGDAAGDTYFGIEAVYGSAFDDALTGNSSTNELRGGIGDDVLDGAGGNDRLHGDAGADTLIGGAGTDSAYYTQSSAGVTLNLATGGTFGDAAGDSYSSIEWVFGSDFDDAITGDGGANRLYGEDGNDTLNGGAGNDRLLGGNGDDIIFGGEGVDTLFGQAGANTLFGDGGNDFFFAGAGTQADSFNGGDGFDTVSYLASTNSIIIDSGQGGTIGGSGDATSDSYISIERILGTNFADTMFGGAGDDIYFGYGGEDLIGGGAGNDSLFGGAGSDDFYFDTSIGGADVVGDFQALGPVQDQIYITGSDPNYDTFAEVMAAASQVGANTIFDFGNGNTLTLVGVDMGDLDAGDFGFI